MSANGARPRLDHVALRVSDLNAAIAFYREKLELKLLFQRVDEAHHEAFAFFELDGGNLELLQPLDERNRPRPFTPPPIAEPYCPHVAMGVSDLEAVTARLHGEKIPIVQGPLEIANTVRWLYASDPDNNIIEFVQWL